MSKVKVKQGERSPISAARKTALRALSSRPDSEIDYSDQAQLTDHFWQNAQPNPFYKPLKTQASVRIDADVMAWLKSEGKGYQTRMNAILRDAMLNATTQRSPTP